MKWLLPCVLVVMVPQASVATALTPDTPPVAVVAEPLLLTGSLVLAVHNLYSMKSPSLFWSSMGMVVGALSLALTTADSAALPLADGVIGAMSFFVGLARFPRTEAAATSRTTAGVTVHWRRVAIVARF